MLELTEVEEVSVGLGAYSTHAAATIAAAMVAVRTTKVRICELLTLVIGRVAEIHETAPVSWPPQRLLNGCCTAVDTPPLTRGFPV